MTLTPLKPEFGRLPAFSETEEVRFANTESLVHECLHLGLRHLLGVLGEAPDEVVAPRVARHGWVVMDLAELCNAVRANLATAREGGQGACDVLQVFRDCQVVLHLPPGQDLGVVSVLVAGPAPFR